MAEWKDGRTAKQVAREVLRSYLIRCHRIVAKDYPEIANMEPANAADYLLHLQDTKRIDIQLYSKTPDGLGCRITKLPPESSDCGRPDD